MSTTSPTVAPEAIDGSFVPAGRVTVASVEIDGEVVLLDGRSGVLRNLDPLGGIVWSCFDASGTIDEIVTDLCAEFGADRDAVHSDVLGLARALGRDGLLEGVAGPAPPDRHDHDGHDHDGHDHDGHDHDGHDRRAAAAVDLSEPRFLVEPASS